MNEDNAAPCAAESAEPAFPEQVLKGPLLDPGGITYRTARWCVRYLVHASGS
jgi:hypothetical protein